MVEKFWDTYLDTYLGNGVLQTRKWRVRASWDTEIYFKLVLLGLRMGSVGDGEGAMALVIPIKWKKFRCGLFEAFRFGFDQKFISCFLIAYITLHWLMIPLFCQWWQQRLTEGYQMFVEMPEETHSIIDFSMALKVPPEWFLVEGKTKFGGFLDLKPIYRQLRA